MCIRDRYQRRVHGDQQQEEDTDNVLAGTTDVVVINTNQRLDILQPTTPLSVLSNGGDTSRSLKNGNRLHSTTTEAGSHSRAKTTTKKITPRRSGKPPASSSPHVHLRVASLNEDAPFPLPPLGGASCSTGTDSTLEASHNRATRENNRKKRSRRKEKLQLKSVFDSSTSSDSENEESNSNSSGGDQSSGNEDECISSGNDNISSAVSTFSFQRTTINKAQRVFNNRLSSSSSSNQPVANANTSSPTASKEFHQLFSLAAEGVVDDASVTNKAEKKSTLLTDSRVVELDAYNYQLKTKYLSPQSYKSGTQGNQFKLQDQIEQEAALVLEQEQDPRDEDRSPEVPFWDLDDLDNTPVKNALLISDDDDADDDDRQIDVDEQGENY
eukprot:TRINITY_DN90398_c0_g1_i1.p1 TRINITY_DN90398_c0_g1~~TRINITY_DN90398_c0_g1_i1.p1  ORF type:complete len:384 (-),score=57.87 TRINITY_DN90398_c0_g1_i1:136-1287(-)